MTVENSTKPKIPQRLKGFNDFFGKDMRLRQFVIGVFTEVFEKYGYEPLETPALEYSELMLGQSGDEAEKLYYRFNDNGGRDVMLKYENMISMTRAVAQNINNIQFPYKRYQIQRVWRAENVQKGRYREFTQCDADTIGTSSVIADAEFIQMGVEIVGKLGFTEYEARLSNRKLLEGLAEYVGLFNDKFYEYSMSIDKLDKIGREKVIDEMVDLRGIDRKLAEQTMDILDPKNFSGKSFDEIIEIFKATVGKNERGKEGLNELKTISEYLKTCGIDESKYRFDPTIARGLASYTGPVWEFVVTEGNVGSIGGCGRYDKAIGKYTGYDVPATGGSFGIERICDIMKDRNMKEFTETPSQVLVTVFDESTLIDSIKTANDLRRNGLSVMLYPEFDKLGKQIKYADKKGIPFVLIIGPDEKQKGEFMLKDMKNQTEDRYIDINKLVMKISA